MQGMWQQQQQFMQGQQAFSGLHALQGYDESSLGPMQGPQQMMQPGMNGLQLAPEQLGSQAFPGMHPGMEGAAVAAYAQQVWHFHA